MFGTATVRDAIVGVLVLAIVLVAAVIAARARARRALAGVWVGDGDWLASAGLESAQLFLARAPARGKKSAAGNTAGAGGGWRGYLVMVGAGGGLVANGAVSVDIGSCAGSLLISAFSSRATTAPVALRADAGAGAEPGDAPALPPLPAGLRASLSPDGVLTVFDKRRLFARLVRDPAASGDALAAFRSA